MCGWYAAVTLGLSLTTAAPPPAPTELPSPVLDTVFPAGGRAGTTVAVTADGSGLDGLTALRFAARAGQRVVLDCWAERIDSKLRGVLEVYDARGKRLAVSRGRAGLDPQVDFLVPADGAYAVRLFDQTYAGGAAHFYRLDLDTGPRPEFTVPAVVPPGKTTRVTLFGRNLQKPSPLPRESQVARRD